MYSPPSRSPPCSPSRRNPPSARTSPGEHHQPLVLLQRRLPYGRQRSGAEPASGDRPDARLHHHRRKLLQQEHRRSALGGNSGTFPDPVGKGALRFTNGSPYGYSENGGIVSTTPFPTGQGISITFKTVTYRGNSGGSRPGRRRRHQFLPDGREPAQHRHHHRRGERRRQRPRRLGRQPGLQLLELQLAL